MTSLVEELRRQCRAAPGRIAFGEAEDVRVLQAADRILMDGAAASIVLVGSAERGAVLAREARVDLARHGAKIRWVAPPASADVKTALGVSAAMLAAGEVDAVLAGNQATTADVIRAGIGGVGLAPGCRTVSGSFIMYHPEREVAHVFADCGVVIAPTVRQLVDIASESVKTWSLVFPRIAPAVAFLSYSTKGSAQHETATKMAEAAAEFRSRFPGVASDGEMQFDAAVDAAIGERKAPGSPVAGKANVFVFPDLGAGNIAYKIAQRLAGYEAYGPILQGLAKPFSDLSRGATVNDLVAGAYVNLVKARAGLRPG